MQSGQKTIDTILSEAVEITSDDERKAYLDRICGDDTPLRREAERLVADHFEAGEFLEKPAAILNVTIDQPLTEQPGTQVGPYKLVERIGEGGFGVVYRAEQLEPIRRSVAVKIIKPGMDTQEVIARFDAERQALALMDHPCIAKVFDAGATENGRPYFVMELVKGISFTDYCDQCNSSTQERLELFISVCKAVQHAHQKGIIHRDLKPTNVLVAVQDGQLAPKIIDFGVAKAMNQRLTKHTLVTAFAQIVGTPLYMSPEQAEMSPLEVDTRTDVYSLGVLLYELLTGTTPFEKTRLEKASFDELRRIIREEDAPRPSARISTLNADLATTVAERRRTDARKLLQTVRGELDWIVMKCLEKDRNRRYESANALARDVERYLADEPVEACPPSAAYRFGKFARRHRAVLAAAGVLLAVLILAVVGMGIGTALIWRANHETHLALEQRRQLSYFQQIALAEREWSANNFTRAEELIEQCPPDLRGWEWHYLTRLRGRQLPALRHQNMVRSFAVSPDGTRLVSCDETGQVYCWDINTGHMIRQPVLGHDDKGCGEAAFSSDGRSFATSSWTEVCTWDATSGEKLSSWVAPSGAVQGLVWEPNGRLIGCISSLQGEDAGTVIWDVLANERLFEVDELRGYVFGIDVSPNAQLLAVACEDKTVRILNSRTGTQVRVFRGTSQFWHVRFSPDGKLIAATSGRHEGELGSGTVQIWDIASGEKGPTLTGHGAIDVAFSPDGRRLVTSGTDQAVKIWDAESGEEILTLRAHSDFVWCVAFTPDGSRVISASDDRTIRIWDGRPWADTELIGDGAITLNGHTDSVNSVAFHPHQPWLATASADGTIKFWDTRSWHELRTVESKLETVEALAFNPEGDLLAVLGSPSDSVILLKTTALDEIASTLEHSQRLDIDSGEDVPMSIAFSPDGRRLAAGDDGGCTTIINLKTGEIENRFQAPGKFAYSVSFGPGEGGRYVAVGMVNGSLRIWDTSTGQEIDASPLLHQGTLLDVAFSPDGKSLASVAWDRTVHIWNTADWTWSEQLFNATSAPQTVAFSPDGEYLAWGTQDSTLRLWRRTTGELHTLRGHLDLILGVAFSPDGRYIASASEDGTAKIWPVPYEHFQP